MRFSIGGVRIEISFLFCILLSCLVLFDRGVFLFAFLMVCVHEIAHLFAMLLFGVKIDGIALEPFGILIKKELKALLYYQNMCIVFAGCFANFLLAGICIFLYCFFEKNNIFMRFFSINIALAVFNLLPITGLDGGQALQLMIAHYRSAKNAEIIGKIASSIGCVLLLIFGMIICFKIRLNPSLCFLSLFLLILSDWDQTKGK